MQTAQPTDDADRKRRIRRNAWLLALVAIGFYAAFIVIGMTKG